MSSSVGQLKKAGEPGLFQEVQYTEEHVHNRSRCFGKSGDQSGTDWAVEADLTPFRAISGNNDFGGDANDEALLMGTSDTPVIPGKTKFDPGRIIVIATSSTTPWVLRLIYGSGTIGDAEAAGQYSCRNFIKESNAGWTGKLEISLPLLTCGVDKLWLKAKNATDNATIDFLLDEHEYD